MHWHRQSEIEKEHKLKPGDFPKWRGENLKPGDDWHQKVRAIFISRPAYLSFCTVRGVEPLIPEPSAISQTETTAEEPAEPSREPVTRMKIVKAARNDRWVMGDLNGQKVPVAVRRGVAKKVIGKIVEVTETSPGTYACALR